MTGWHQPPAEEALLGQSAHQLPTSPAVPELKGLHTHSMSTISHLQNLNSGATALMATIGLAAWATSTWTKAAQKCTGENSKFDLCSMVLSQLHVSF